MSFMTHDEINYLIKNMKSDITPFIYKYFSFLSMNKIPMLELDDIFLLIDFFEKNNGVSRYYHISKIKSKFLDNFLSHLEGDKNTDYKKFIDQTQNINDKDRLQYFNYTHYCFATKNHHPFTFEKKVVDEFAELLKYKNIVTTDWDCLQSLYNMFIKLPYKKQVAIYKKASSGLRDELLYHDSNFFHNLSNDISNNNLIQSDDIKKIAGLNNYNLLRSMVDNLKKGTQFRKKYISDNIDIFLMYVELDGQDYYFLLVTLLENVKDFDKVIDFLDKIPLKFLKNTLTHEFFDSGETYDKTFISNVNLVITLISTLFASDPFINEEYMKFVLESYVNTNLKEKISYVSLDYIANHFINSANFSYETLVLISTLYPQWEGTYRELYNACEKL